MSFGFSIGDFISVGSLALSLYLSYRDGPSEIREVSRELLSLHTTLEELRHDLENPDSTISRSSSKKTRNLQGLIARCKEPLEELEAIYQKYVGMGSWQRLKIGKEDIDCIRHKLGLHLTGLTLFLTGISHEALARMENRLEVLGRLEAKVDQLFAELRAPQDRNDPHPILATLSKRDQSAVRGPDGDNLKLVVHALGDYGGVSSEDVCENSTFVNALVTWHWDTEVRDAQKKRSRKTRQNHRRRELTSISPEGLTVGTMSSVTASPEPPSVYVSMGETKTPEGERMYRDQRKRPKRQKQTVKQGREREKREHKIGVLMDPSDEEEIEVVEIYPDPDCGRESGGELSNRAPSTPRRNHATRKKRDCQCKDCTRESAVRRWSRFVLW